MRARSFHRYVALGDSVSEGHGDGPLEAPRGWADRLAERLAASTSPQLGYANLAVRGCRAWHVHRLQVPSALALEPDLATVVSGMNDLFRPDFDAAQTLGHLEAAICRMREAGCEVVTMTFPDIGRLHPVLSWLRPRQAALNAGIAVIAARQGARLVDLHAAPLVEDPALWSRDRIHGSPAGHDRIAAGVAEALGLPGSDASWRAPATDRAASPAQRARAEAAWVATYLVPFAVRTLRGRTPILDRAPKRPLLSPAAAELLWESGISGPRPALGCAHG